MQDFNTLSHQIADLRSDIIIPLVAENPKRKEPSPEDLDLVAQLDNELNEFAELDALLAESIKYAKKSQSQKYKAMIVESIRIPEVTWRATENLRVWQRTKCQCGIESPAMLMNLFEYRIGGGIKQWVRVESHREGLPVFNTIKTLLCDKCQICDDLGELVPHEVAFQTK